MIGIFPGLWVWALPFGLILDAILGDPSWMPHPVRWIGRYAIWLEAKFRQRGWVDIWAGSLFWFAVVAPVAVIVGGLCVFTAHVHPWLGQFFQVWVVYQGLALRDLEVEVSRIHGRLLANDLSGAQKATSRIVSRSTQGMNEAAISRSALESAAENGVDGVLSPLFWAILLGPVGLWVFKAASTLDSMVGYRTPQYEMFGKASARIDDVLNWIPARLSLIFYPLAMLPYWKDALRGYRVGRRDHGLHASPNSGYGESIMAGLLGVRLGGPAVYHGERKEKPWFGAEFRDAVGKDIPKGLQIVQRATWIMVLCVWGIAFLHSSL